MTFPTPTDPRPRYFIYARVSSEDQVKGHSIDSQLEICNRYVEFNGGIVVGVYKDEAKSAYKNHEKRLDFLRMLNDVRAGGCDRVAIYKIDRFSRNTIRSLTFLNEFVKQDIQFCSVCEQMDFTTPEGKLMFTNMAGWAQYYSENLSRVTKVGKEARAKKGYWNGDLSWGYRLAEDGINAEPDPVTSPGYKMAVKMYLSGAHSDATITSALNAKGYLTSNKTPFSKDTVRSMLTNIFYTGQVTYKSTVYPGKHQPLISVEDYERLQEVRRSKRLMPRCPNHSARVYPLSRLCQCADCGRTLRGISLGRNHDTRYYWCPDKGQYSGKCQSKSYRNAEHIERQVSNIFSDIKLPSDWMARTMQYLQAGRDFDADERRRSRLKEKLKRLAEMYTEGTYSRDEYSRKVLETKAELDSIKPATAPKLNIARAAEMLTNFANLYKGASPEKQQRLFQLMLERVFVAEMDVIAIQPQRDFYPLLICGGPDGHPLANRLTKIPVKLVQPATPLTRIPFLIYQGF